MNKEVQEILKMRWKRAMLEYAEGIGNIQKACKEFNIHRSAFYKWKKAYKKEGFEGPRRKKPIPYSHPRKISMEVVNKVLDLRQTYQLGSNRISWYLERYHGISISESSVTRILGRYGINRLPKTASRRTVRVTL